MTDLSAFYLAGMVVTAVLILAAVATSLLCGEKAEALDAPLGVAMAILTWPLFWLSYLAHARPKD